MDNKIKKMERNENTSDGQNTNKKKDKEHVKETRPSIEIKEPVVEQPKEDILELEIKPTHTDKHNVKEVKQIENKIKDINMPFNLTLSEVFVNLILIAKIEIGDKIFHTGKFMNIDTRYLAFFYRWFANIDRNDSIKFINCVLNQAFEYNKKMMEYNDDGNNNLLLFRLTSDLKNCINGLNNLKHTYNNDKLILSELDVIIDNIRTVIDANSKNLKFFK